MRSDWSRRFVAALGCMLLSACDQFVPVGVLASAGMPAPPLAGAPSVMDIAVARAIADAAVDGPPAATDAGMIDEAEPMCTAPDVAVCNPVTNEGCQPGIMMHCAVDFAADTLAGYCIFLGPPPPAGVTTCLSTVATESCGPKSSCVSGTCRTLCFCDSDCPADQCCTEPIGDRGFKVCASC